MERPDIEVLSAAVTNSLEGSNIAILPTYPGYQAVDSALMLAPLIRQTETPVIIFSEGELCRLASSLAEKLDDEQLADAIEVLDPREGDFQSDGFFFLFCPMERYFSQSVVSLAVEEGEAVFVIDLTAGWTTELSKLAARLRPICETGPLKLLIVCDPCQVEHLPLPAEEFTVVEHGQSSGNDAEVQVEFQQVRDGASLADMVETQVALGHSAAVFLAEEFELDDLVQALMEIPNFVGQKAEVLALNQQTPADDLEAFLQVDNERTKKVLLCTHAFAASSQIPGFDVVISQYREWGFEDGVLAKVEKPLPQSLLNRLKVWPADGGLVEVCEESNRADEPTPILLQVPFKLFCLLQFADGEGDLTEVAFLHRPSESCSVQELQMLGALTLEEEPSLTSDGEVMVELRARPQVTRVLATAVSLGHLEEGLLLAAITHIGDFTSSREGKWIEHTKGVTDSLPLALYHLFLACEAEGLTDFASLGIDPEKYAEVGRCRAKLRDVVNEVLEVSELPVKEADDATLRRLLNVGMADHLYVWREEKLIPVLDDGAECRIEPGTLVCLREEALYVGRVLDNRSRRKLIGCLSEIDPYDLAKITHEVFRAEEDPTDAVYDSSTDEAYMRGRLFLAGQHLTSFNMPAVKTQPIKAQHAIANFVALHVRARTGGNTEADRKRRVLKLPTPVLAVVESYVDWFKAVRAENKRVPHADNLALPDWETLRKDVATRLGLAVRLSDVTELSSLGPTEEQKQPLSDSIANYPEQFTPNGLEDSCKVYYLKGRNPFCAIQDDDSWVRLTEDNFLPNGEPLELAIITDPFEICPTHSIADIHRIAVRLTMYYLFKRAQSTKDFIVEDDIPAPKAPRRKRFRWGRAVLRGIGFKSAEDRAFQESRDAAVALELLSSGQVVEQDWAWVNPDNRSKDAYCMNPLSAVDRERYGRLKLYRKYTNANGDDNRRNSLNYDWGITPEMAMGRGELRVGIQDLETATDPNDHERVIARCPSRNELSSWVADRKEIKHRPKRRHGAGHNKRQPAHGPGKRQRGGKRPRGRR